MSNRLEEGKDYYFNDKGLMVLTAEFLRKRGYCCKNHCLHCPYGYSKNSKEPVVGRASKKRKL